MKEKGYIFILLLFVLVIGTSIQTSAKTSSSKTYKITYKLNKGTNNKKNPTKYKSKKSKKLYSPTRTGYTFKGWYSDKKFKVRVKKIKKGSKGNIKLYAKWSAKSYKITYKLNSGTNNASNVKTYTYAKTVTLYNPTRTGYVFKGWYTDSAFTNKVTKIKKGTTTGSITLYAKWELEALNINQTGSADMIWNWWYYPQVMSYEGTGKHLYWGFATSEGYCGIASYDYTTQMTSKTILKKSPTIDDHNGAAITVMPDGKIMCVYSGGHNTNNEIHVRISNEPESIEKFDTSVVLISSGKTCYSQILQYNGTYYIFYRVDNKKWAYRSSKDGVKWTDEIILISSTMQYYCKFMPTTEDGIIRVCMYSNPTESDPNIRMGFLNLNNGKLYNADNKTELGTNNITHTKFDILISKLTGLTQRLFDVAITEPENPMIMYATFATSKSSKDSSYKIYDNGNEIDICQGGNPLWNPKYQLGAAFMGTDKIVVAREEAGYDNIELYSYTEGNIEFKESVYTEEIGEISIRNARPIIDVNGNAFLWHRGYYNQSCYTDFFTEAKIYFMDN